MNAKLPQAFVTNKECVVEMVPQGRNEWLSRSDITGSQGLMMCRVTIPPGQDHAFHVHPELDEIIYVLSGEAEQWVDRQKRILTAGAIAHIAKGVVHATFNVGSYPLQILAILSPGNHVGPFLVDVSEDEPWRTARVSVRT